MAHDQNSQVVTDDSKREVVWKSGQVDAAQAASLIA
jgi:hypothetical protein